MVSWASLNKTPFCDKAKAGQRQKCHIIDLSECLRVRKVGCDRALGRVHWQSAPSLLPDWGTVRSNNEADRGFASGSVDSANWGFSCAEFVFS